MERLIVYGGAFNPLTKAHAAAIRALVTRFGQDALVLLPSGTSFVKKWKAGEEVLPDVVRVDLLTAFLRAEGFERVTVSGLCLAEELCTYEALARLKKEYGAQDAMFVIGEDKLPELPRWKFADKLLAQYAFVVLTYGATGAPAGIRGEYLTLPGGTEDAHASQLRRRMAAHDPALRNDAFLGPHLTRYPECVRIAACAPQVVIGNPAENAQRMIARAAQTDADVLVFPELSICGYTCADMFLSPPFVAACEAAVAQVAQATAAGGQLLFIGCPVRVGERLFNCALALCGGRLLAVIPKTHLANYGEFYERRWFSAAAEATEDTVDLLGQTVPFGTNILVREKTGGLCIAAEICEDAWVPLPPGLFHCVAGARMIVNLSASNDIVSKVEYRRSMLSMLSAQGICAYAYASSGAGESSSDLVFGGHRMILMNGRVAAESRSTLAGEGEDAQATLDLSMLAADRGRMKSFAAVQPATAYRYADYVQQTYRFPPAVPPQPFVPPATGRARRQRCLDILELQAKGLCQRVRGTGISKLVIGISGGLDSTLALLVARTAFDALEIPLKNIVTVTMPCFATSERTLKNATDLCRQLGTDFRKVDISEAVMLHGRDIGHDMNNTDIAYENIQARERTQILMDIANMEGALVVGTGDLSELALGWCTYNGDHISHYGVNCGVPKTLVKFIVDAYADEFAAPDTCATLKSILDTEITPELVPGGASTQARIGRYELHDFFLYYFMRYGFSREKLRFMAAEAFGAAQLAEIDQTLATFMKRFFQNQFKRNCLPDGPKIGSVCLSPRGDLRLPADASQNWFVNSEHA